MKTFPTTLLVPLACLLMGISANAASFMPKDIDSFDGMKVYQLGNSHTDSIREELAGLVGAAGKAYRYGTHTIPGAPLRWLRDHPDDSFDHLREHAWDAVTLQTYNSTTEEEIQAAIAYSAAALEGNPDVHILLYTIWPKEEDWDTPPHGRSEEWTETVAARIREAHPDARVSVAPTSLTTRRFGNMADAGLIPGLSGRRDLYGDPGHLGRYGAYGIAVAMYAILYQASPLGLPSQVMEARGGQPQEAVAYDVGEETAAAIQRMIWDTLAEYPHDGLDTGMVINSGFMPPALVGRPYSEPLPIINAPESLNVQLAAGELPQGLHLEGHTIVGTPTEETASSFTVRAEAGGQTAERELKLYSERERPLEIVIAEELDLARDQYLITQLETQGAIGGRVKWAVADGRLPNGLRLADSGLLLGTPGETGTFTPILQATDNHPDGPRSAQEELRIVVGPASPDAYRVPRTAQKIENDGKLDEPFWDFQPIYDADGNAVAHLSVVYYQGEKRPDKDRDFYIALRVAEPDKFPYPRESVHLYFDLAHNREVIYNEDDLHVVFPIENDRLRADVVQGYKHSHAFRRASGMTNDDGSWQMELELSSGFFAGFNVHTFLVPNTTYGFNIAIGSQDDPEQRVYWRGDAGVDKDTTGFGSLVIEEIE